MKNDYAKVDRISTQGYTFEFGTVLEITFENYKKIALTAGLTTLLIGLLVGILLVAIIGISYGFSELTQTFAGLRPELMSGSSLIVMLLVSTLLAALMSPINAGFIKMAYLADHDREFGVSTVFDYFRGNYFKELFIATAILTFFSTGINYLISFMGILFWGSLVSYIIAFLTFLTIPLIIFSNLTATQAISMSVRLVLKQPLLLLGLMIVGVVFACLGLIGFCIGVFFTLPFLYSLYYSIYTTIIPSEEDVLDEIGQTAE